MRTAARFQWSAILALQALPGVPGGVPLRGIFYYHGSMSEYPMNPLHSAWLALESKSTPMHVGVLLYFRRPARAKADYVQRLAASWLADTQVQPPWNGRLHRARRWGWSAAWVSQKEVDLDYHFRHSALPSPGGERELGELVSRLHSHPLDLAKPPWEVHLIEGLHGDRFAVYIKLHPALMDGVNAMRAVASFLSPDRAVRDLRPIWAQIQTRPPSGATVLRDWPQLLGALRARITGGLRSSISWTGVRRVPRSALNDRLTAQRRFATQQYARTRLEAVAAPLQASAEELLYYLCASALRRFLREFNALPDDSLVALLADRSRDDGMLSPVFFSLGTAQANKHKRLAEIRQSLKLARRQFAVLPPADARAEGAVDAMPYLLRQMLGVDHRLAPMFNLGIVRLALSEEPLYFNGAQLDAAFPMPMLLQGGALNIACLEYAGQWSVGLCGARENLPHLQRIAVYMGLALEELEAMANE